MFKGLSSIRLSIRRGLIQDFLFSRWYLESFYKFVRGWIEIFILQIMPKNISQILGVDQYHQSLTNSRDEPGMRIFWVFFINAISSWKFFAFCKILWISIGM
jgi:hypothetical protein